MDFYEALRPRHAEVTLGGRTLTVERVRLARFLELDAIARENEPDKMLRYVSLAARVPVAELEGLRFNELYAAYAALRQLNGLSERFPFMTSRSRRDILDYPGRELASIVHRLAHAYGWSRDYICNLFPEEAFAYVLEIIIAQHEEREYLYSISSVGFDKEGKKHAFPKLLLSWPDQEAAVKLIPMSKAKLQDIGLIPAGLVIDLSQLGRN